MNICLYKMSDIIKIYHNSFGVAFRWKPSLRAKNCQKIQLVFREMGFHLSIDEIGLFRELIQDSLNQELCESCEANKDCKAHLLQTPSTMVNLAISYNELTLLDELVTGTLFYAKFDAEIKALL